MKIWFDLSNSPHINFFASMIRELRAEHEVIITCRPLANTIDLLNVYGFPHTVVGKHYGASLARKIYGYPVRVWQLYKTLRRLRPDVAISHSSFHSPLVARLLGIRSIYLNDNEHASGNIPAFLAATAIMIPEFLSVERVLKQGASRRKVIQYPGVKEGVYLWNFGDLRTPDVLSDFRREGKKTICIRPEPWLAQYYTGGINFLDPLLNALKEQAHVVLLPRGLEQAVHFRGPEFEGITVLEGAVGLADIAPQCDLFIGAGGTMTREMAVLGIPTISVYQSELLDVDRFLLDQGLLIHRPQLTAEEVMAYLVQRARGVPNRVLLEKGRQAYLLIKETLLGG
jgi:uncharacterized protein